MPVSTLTTDFFRNKRWKLPNGDFHKEDGPAIEWSNGTKEWWVNGHLHREDGPALEYPNGQKYWYLYGKNLSEKQHKLLAKKKYKISRIKCNRNKK